MGTDGISKSFVAFLLPVGGCFCRLVGLEGPGWEVNESAMWVVIAVVWLYIDQNAKGSVEEGIESPGRVFQRVRVDVDDELEIPNINKQMRRAEFKISQTILFNFSSNSHK